MTNKNRLSFALATAFGLGLVATASIAGPLVLGPAPAPIVHVAPVVHPMVPIQTSALNSYRALRAFWISKAIVR